MAGRRDERLVDHLLTWILVAPLAAMSLGLLIGPYLSRPNVRDGFDGVALFWAIAFGYGAAAVFQQQYTLVPAWRPGWSQGLGAVWFGGWTFLTIGALIQDFFDGGPALVWHWFGPAALLWGLFVAVPLIGARLIVGSRKRYKGWTE
jgi:hypothetical protein